MCHGATELRSTHGENQFCFVHSGLREKLYRWQGIKEKVSLWRLRDPVAPWPRGLLRALILFAGYCFSRHIQDGIRNEITSSFPDIGSNGSLLRIGCLG